MKKGIYTRSLTRYAEVENAGNIVFVNDTARIEIEMQNDGSLKIRKVVFNGKDDSEQIFVLPNSQNGILIK